MSVATGYGYARSWSLATYIAFDNQGKAFKFERYLKTGSGRAFAKKTLLNGDWFVPAIPPAQSRSFASAKAGRPAYAADVSR